MDAIFPLQRSLYDDHPLILDMSPYICFAVYPAIGEAIDDDGSGFVSVYEVNKFLRAIPEGWSTPQWLALFVRFPSFYNLPLLTKTSPVGQLDGTRTLSCQCSKAVDN